MTTDHQAAAPGTDPAPADQGHEIAYLLALLAVLWPSFIGPDPAPGAEGCARLVIVLPTGRASWQVPAEHLDLFGHVLPMPAEGMPAAAIVGPGETYRRVFNLAIGRVSISEQAAGVRAAERSRIRGWLSDDRVSCRCHSRAAVHWSDLEAALEGSPDSSGSVAMLITTPVKVPQLPPAGLAAARKYLEWCRVEVDAGFGPVEMVAWAAVARALADLEAAPSNAGGVTAPA